MIQIALIGAAMAFGSWYTVWWGGSVYDVFLFWLFEMVVVLTYLATYAVAPRRG